MSIINLEELLERTKELPLVKDYPYFDIYDSKTWGLVDFSQSYERLNRIKEEEFAVFSSQTIMYSDGDTEVVFYIIPISPNGSPVSLLNPYTERTYLVSAYSPIQSKTEKIPREEASYVIKGSFVEDEFVRDMFVALRAVEAGYNEPRKTADLPLEQADMLMDFLRKSNLFPQNEREEEIALGFWASRYCSLIRDGSNLDKKLKGMEAYARLLER